MASRASPVHYRRNVSAEHYAQAARVLLAVCGTMLALLGSVLALGGLLSPINGSAFHALAGLGLIVSGALVAKRRRVGASILLVVFAGTLTWALRNIEAGGSSLGQRLMGPSVLLLMIAVLLPVLCEWRPRAAALAFAVMLTGTVGLGFAASPDGPLARPMAAITHFLDSHTDGVTI
jgi:quinoprotein glucose dehydrogenase